MHYTPRNRQALLRCEQAKVFAFQLSDVLFPDPKVLERFFGLRTGTLKVPPRDPPFCTNSATHGREWWVGEKLPTLGPRTRLRRMLLYEHETGETDLKANRKLYSQELRHACHSLHTCKTRQALLRCEQAKVFAFQLSDVLFPDQKVLERFFGLRTGTLKVPPRDPPFCTNSATHSTLARCSTTLCAHRSSANFPNSVKRAPSGSSGRRRSQA